MHSSAEFSPEQQKDAPLFPVDSETYLRAMLEAPRPGHQKILAFYDHRVGMICRDPRLLLIPLDDHICHRGDGLFESICFRENRIFALDAHLARLIDGAATLAIQPPCPFEMVEERILDVARASGASHGDLRVFLSRGPGGFGVSPAECPEAGLYIVALASELPDPQLYLRGLTAFSSGYPPKQEYLARIKNTNYLPNVFMAVEAAQKNMDVAVTFDDEGNMGEAAIANVAIVDESGCLRTPHLRRILPGTTLVAAMEIASQRMCVHEGPVHRHEILRAREVLLFTSATLCVAITHFDGRPVGDGENAGKPGPVALWLKDALLAYMLRNGTPFAT